MDAEISESAARAAEDIRIAVGRLRRRFREASGSEGLTPSQSSVLSRLHRDGPASASEIAAAERVRPQSAAAWLDALTGLGLVERTPDPDDGRRRLISITDDGRAHLANRRRAGEHWLATALQERFTEDERQAVIVAMGLLDRLVAP